MIVIKDDHNAVPDPDRLSQPVGHGSASAFSFGSDASSRNTLPRQPPAGSFRAGVNVARPRFRDVSPAGSVIGPGRKQGCTMPPAAIVAATDAYGSHSDLADMPAEGARILVVDDNVDSADSMAILLSLDGHEVRVAFDGPTALAAAAEFSPQAVLLDIGLPGMDGYEVARRLRERTENRNILLVAITGYGQDEDRIRSKEAGFDHHLVKPVDPDILSRVLEALQEA
jgi:CheY-like chemotaxis protein